MHIALARNTTYGHLTGCPRMLHAVRCVPQPILISSVRPTRNSIHSFCSRYCILYHSKCLRLKIPQFSQAQARPQPPPVTQAVNDVEKHTRFISNLLGVDKAFRVPCTIFNHDGSEVRLDKCYVQADQSSNMRTTPRPSGDQTPPKTEINERVTPLDFTPTFLDTKHSLHESEGIINEIYEEVSWGPYPVDFIDILKFGYGVGGALAAKSRGCLR